jgi:hypothetical protein
MNYSKIASKSSFVILSAVACATLVATDASAQRRGGGGGGGRSSGGGTVVGRAAPRGTVGGSIGGPRGVAPRIIGRAPYYPYYYRPGYYRPGISLGFYLGSPFYYGYPYGYYGYPYGYYGAAYGYYGYPGYGYGGYGYPSAGYGYGSRGAYGSVRIQGAPREAEVYADGYYVGIVDDFDGAFKHLELEPGAHNIEIRAPGLPPTAFEVNIQPGRTVTFHVR